MIMIYTYSSRLLYGHDCLQYNKCSQTRYFCNFYFVLLNDLVEYIHSQYSTVVSAASKSSSPLGLFCHVGSSCVKCNIWPHMPPCYAILLERKMDERPLLATVEYIARNTVGTATESSSFRTFILCEFVHVLF